MDTRRWSVMFIFRVVELFTQAQKDRHPTDHARDWKDESMYAESSHIHSPQSDQMDFEEWEEAWQLFEAREGLITVSDVPLPPANALRTMAADKTTYKKLVSVHCRESLSQFFVICHCLNACDMFCARHCCFIQTNGVSGIGRGMRGCSF